MAISYNIRLQVLSGDVMYVIAIYDVDSKRDPKVMKVLRKYIFGIHNSVFEGEITPS